MRSFGVDPVGLPRAWPPAVYAPGPAVQFAAPPDPAPIMVPPPVQLQIPVQPAMTEEQVETLQRQISVYTTICHQLAEMQKAIVQEQSQLPGVVVNHMFDHPSLGNAMHRVSARQRWTPSQNQLRILERLFRKGGGTPNKQRIKEITAELSAHGAIQETNVYNWFQNRKARAKRKTGQSTAMNGESDGETEADCSDPAKRARLDGSCSGSGSGHGNGNGNGNGADML